MSLNATQTKLAEALARIDTYPTCDAGTIYKTKYNMRRLLAAIPQEDPATKSYNYSVILYRDIEWGKLPQNQVPNPVPAIGAPAMVDGPAWVPPVNPGRPTGTSYAATDQWRWERDTANQYELVLAWAREAIQKAFKNKSLLMDKEDALGNLTHRHPLDLLDYLWQTRSNKRQIDRLIAAAKKELDVEFDPSEEATNYFAKLEEARYILIELKQNHAASDDDLIRIALLEFEKHEDWDDAAKDFRKLQVAGSVTWEQLKEEIIKFETDHSSKQTTKKSLGLANAAMQLVEQQGTDLENAQTLLITQNHELMSLKKQMEELKQTQVTHQANAAIAAAAAAAAAAAPTPLISNVTQPAAPTQQDAIQQLLKALNNNGNQNKGGNNNGNRFENKYPNRIGNDLVDDQRSKRRYPNSMAYCSTCGFDVSPNHGEQS